MTEQRSEGGLIRYYCTAGNGMEPFLIDEVKKKLAAENVGISCTVFTWKLSALVLPY